MNTKFDFDTEFYVYRNDEEIVMQVVGTYVSDPGRCSGPPEDCSPPEEDFNYKISGWGGVLTDEEEETLLDEVRMLIQDDAERDYDDDDDCDYDPDPSDEYEPDYWD